MMMLSHAAKVTKGELSGADVLFDNVSKDTRTIRQGALYVALKGDNFDGHAFLTEASEAGAVAALVSEQQVSDLPQVTVKDTRLALGELAASWREKFTGSVIGITGSNGKTTVKEMCRTILAQKYGTQKVMSTQGNLNNDIGVPMTLLGLSDNHQFAVIEMGANHSGEIDYLSNITRPDIAVITNAGYAHIEGFGSIEKVAQAKSEIFNGLSSQGIAIINADDPYCDYWKSRNSGHKIITFSMSSSSADVVAKNISGCTFSVKTPMGNAQITLGIPGRHNIMNALAAIAATLSLGIAIKNIVAALESYTGINGRLQFSKTKNGCELIDDSYNANPNSLNVAINVLVGLGKESWLVMGDMGELGDEAAALHKEAGLSAKKAGVKRLFATGQYSKFAVEGFGSGAVFFDDKNALALSVYKTMNNQVAVLVKGSRSARMEDVVVMLMGDADDEIQARIDNQIRQSKPAGGEK